MDLGATLCTRAQPRCTACPLRHDCVANRDGITGDLPARKPTRSVPTRATLMLLLRDSRGRILLERRPHTGVWAQLWSLPEAQDLASARIRVRREQARGELPELRELKTFVHTFSHYKLDITPLAGEIGSSRRVEDALDRRWVHLHEAAALGLPAPVRKLIELVEES
jgi:A/G-specific adenine glycosylase